MSFFSSKKLSSLSLVFDIRDTSITIAAARFEKGKKPLLVLCQSLKIEGKDLRDHKKYLDSMFKTLDESVISIRKGLIKIGNREKIDKYFFFIGSPWSISESKMIKIMKDRPFEINKRFLEKIISSEENDKIWEIEKKENAINWGVLEEKIVQSKINGYKTSMVFGKKANDLEMELFVSFTPQDIKNKLSSLKGEILNKHRTRQLNSCTLSSYSFFRDLYSDKNDFIYLDIGDLVTDAYVVKNDVICGAVSIPLGRREMIRSTSLRTKTPEDILLSALHINYRGNYINSVQKTQGIMGEGIRDWQVKLNESILKICTETNVPKNIFILINNELTNIFLKEIKSNKTNDQFNIFNESMNIINVEENTINNFITDGAAFKNEPYVKMDLVFLDKMIYNL